MSKDKDNKNTNLVKSTINDQIENNNDEVKETINPEFISVDISCDSCKYNPKNTTKKEQFLNLFGVNIGEEFYIKSDKDRGSYLIYHFSEQFNLLARSSNDKEGIMNWCSPSIGKLLEDDVELIKL
jgi:hypothetical protein